MEYRRMHKGTIVRVDTISRWIDEARERAALIAARPPRKQKRTRGPRLNSRKRRRDRLATERAAQAFVDAVDAG